MMRALLRERFQLRIHTEMRRLPSYGLVVARRDGRLGPNLRKTTITCPDVAAAAAASDPNQWCGIRATGGVIVGRAVSAAQLAGNLSGYASIDRFVADRTGLEGRYDFTMEYSPALPAAGDAALPAGPDLFTALTEQLGLRLRPETMALPVLVIDHVEKPTAD